MILHHQHVYATNTPQRLKPEGPRNRPRKYRRPGTDPAGEAPTLTQGQMVQVNPDAKINRIAPAPELDGLQLKVFMAVPEANGAIILVRMPDGELRPYAEERFEVLS